MQACPLQGTLEGLALADEDRIAVESPADPSAPIAALWRSLGRWQHLVAGFWMAAMAAAVLAPALSHGGSFGSYDLLSQFGVLKQPGVALHNLQAGDQSDQIIPWSTLAWTQVHHGQLPLWNPYSALGMPLAFDWQAAAFSLPAIIGYLFPLNLAFTVEVLLTLLIAGTGAYALGRVLRLGAIACIFIGSVFELSGPMIGWLGWPVSAVYSWSGWLFAATVLVVRGRHRIRHVTLLALVLAAMIYVGQAEILTIVGLALLAFIVVLLGLQASVLKGGGEIRRPVVDFMLAAVAGAALGAPLILPGLQVIRGSQRAVPGGDPAELISGNPPLPLHNAIHLAFQGFDGLPIAGNAWFGYIEGYSETAAYVGVIVLVMALVGMALHWRRPAVIAFGAVVLVSAAAAFVPPVVSILYRLPVVGTILWQRALLPLVFGLVVLSGFGLDALVRHHDRRAVRRWARGGFAVAIILLAALWLWGRGALSPAEASIRSASFAWPLAASAVGLAVVVGLSVANRRSRNGTLDRARASAVGPIAGVLLLGVECAFLIASGASLWTSAPTPFATTPAAMTLKESVGKSIVGFGAPLCFFPPGLGIVPNAQLAYGVQELGLYDPLIPSSYFSSWTALTHKSAGNKRDFLYCPAITSTAQARLYGVGFVLEPKGTPGPVGSVHVRTIGSEDLYRITGSAPATLVPMPVPGVRPPIDAPGRPVAVTRPDPASWRLGTNSSRPSVLRLRLTDVPGWNATVDGRPVPLDRFAGTMLQLEVPAGRHLIELDYWPTAFTVGLILAGCAVIGLFLGSAFSWKRTRGRAHRPSSAQRRRDEPPAK